MSPLKARSIGVAALCVVAVWAVVPVQFSKEALSASCPSILAEFQDPSNGEDPGALRLLQKWGRKVGRALSGGRVLEDDMPGASEPELPNPQTLIQLKAASSSPRSASHPAHDHLDGDGLTMLSAALAASICIALACANAFIVTGKDIDTMRSENGHPNQQLEARCAVLDIAKFWLMLGVMVIHWTCCYSGKKMPWASHIKSWLNPWCTRSFAFLSGSVTKAQPSKRYFQGLTFRLVVPLVVHCCVLAPLLLYAVEHQHMPDFHKLPERITKSLFYADAEAVWYLFAVIQWRIWACLLGSMHPVVQMTTALLFAAFGGYADMRAFKLDEAVASFPLFVAGQLFPLQKTLQRLPRSARSITCGVVAFGLLFVFETHGTAFMRGIPSWGWAPDVKHGLESGVLSHPGAWLFWVRGFFRNVLEFTKCLIFLLVLCPREWSLPSELGKHTLYPYLLHYTALGLCEPWWHRVVTLEHSTRGCLLWLLALVWLFTLNVLLASWPVRYVFGPFYQPAWLESLCVAQPRSECAEAGQKSHPEVACEAQGPEDGQVDRRT